MVEFTNSLTGTRMLVSDSREAEYLAAGHTRVTDKTSEPPAGDTTAEHQAEQTVAEPPEAQPPSAKPATKTSRSAKTKPTAKRSTPAKK